MRLETAFMHVFVRFYKCKLLLLLLMIHEIYSVIADILFAMHVNEAPTASTNWLLIVTIIIVCFYSFTYFTIF